MQHSTCGTPLSGIHAQPVPCRGRSSSSKPRDEQMCGMSLFFSRTAHRCAAFPALIFSPFPRSLPPPMRSDGHGRRCRRDRRRTGRQGRGYPHHRRRRVRCRRSVGHRRYGDHAGGAARDGLHVPLLVARGRTGGGGVEVARKHLRAGDACVPPLGRRVLLHVTICHRPRPRFHPRRRGQYAYV